MEIRRDRYLERLIAHKGNGRVKIVTGIRRCGKSYLLFQLFKRHLIETGVKPNVISKYIFDIFSQSCFDTSAVVFATHLS